MPKVSCKATTADCSNHRRATRPAEKYLEVDPKTRLVYTESMADVDGNAMTAERMGMPPGTPMETSIVVELEDVGARAKMTMTHLGVPGDSPGGAGWAMAIAKMQARVAELCG